MKPLFDFFEKPRNLALFLTLASAGILGFALVTQYVFGHQPCILCRYQRIPYYTVLVVGFFAAALAGIRPKWAFGLLLLSGLAFLSGLGISGYHIGVEQNWWMGPRACGGALPENLSLEAFREYMLNRDIVDCSVPGWTFLGLSMTTYNFVVSLALTVFTFLMAWRGRPKTTG
jgi:disulfide bond formation protein DsbB